ncbi:hypothetical protein OCU04_002438 [Sclerotinia nivalis]|uniref:Uncharacterized protein n=1 Tax=Sclerotinia nivalis TaxID=352851 RepID=A0A9X0ATL8_9HELO|nr:hypothetical protein OCU04_002438 [Sclerotinia nivalis]
MNIDNLPRLPAASTSTSPSSSSSTRTSPSNPLIKNKHKLISPFGNFQSLSIPDSHPPITTPWEENKLYIHLTDRGNPGTFHWSLYLTEDDPEKGWVYHVYDPEPGRWILEMLGPAGPVTSEVDGEGDRGDVGIYAGGNEGDGDLDVEDRGTDASKEEKEDEDSAELNTKGTKDSEVVEENGEGEGEGGENCESGGVGIMASKRNFAEEEEEKTLGNGKRVKVQGDRNEEEEGRVDQMKGESQASFATPDEKDDNYPSLTHTTPLAAVEIGTNIQDMREIIEQTISSIWGYEKRRIGRGDKTCRQFLLHCISEMESLGILSLLPGKSGFDLEREAKEFGMLSDPALNPGARRGRVWKSRIIS